MDTDEDCISLTMDEYSRLQTEILDIKHENSRLKEQAKNYEEIERSLKESQEELSRLKQIENDNKKWPKFSKDVVLDCLKSVRKQDNFDNEQILLIDQIVAVFEYFWPAGGEQDLKTQEFFELLNSSEVKALNDLNQKLKSSLEEISEKYKAISCSLEEAVKENDGKSNRIQELENQKEKLILDLTSRDAEVSDARKKLMELSVLQSENKELADKLKICLNQSDSLKKELETAREAADGGEKLKVVQAELEELKNSENLLNLEYKSLKTSAMQALSDLTQSKNANKELEGGIKKLEDNLKKTHQELEDMKTERQILQKRSMNDLKDLKADLAKEKSMHELCKMEKEKLTQENRKLQESLRAGVKLPPPTHQEKVLVESMSNRMGVLEKENLSLRHKIREIECFVIENERLCKENDDLRNEISRLSEDMAMLGAQFNEYIRSHKT